MSQSQSDPPRDAGVCVCLSSMVTESIHCPLSASHGGQMYCQHGLCAPSQTSLV